MATNFPGSLDSFTNPSSSSTLDSPSHAAQHSNVNDAVEAVEAHLLDGYLYRQTVYFTSSGTFTKASYPWLRAIRVKVLGAGGGGGNAAPTGSTESTEAGGGGGGGYGEKWVTDIAGLSASETITVGGGGSGGTTSGSSGSTGGSSSAMGVTGGGGTGGGGMSPGANFSSRGARGSYSGADWGVEGSDGFMGIAFSYGVVGMNNIGGGSYLGGSENTGPSSNTHGGDGQFYGGGGAGGRNRTQNQATDKDGGNGRAGIVMLELYA